MANVPDSGDEGVGILGKSGRDRVTYTLSIPFPGFVFGYSRGIRIHFPYSPSGELKSSEKSDMPACLLLGADVQLPARADVLGGPTDTSFPAYWAEYWWGTVLSLCCHATQQLRTHF